MKTYLLLAACLILAGCGRQEENHREVLGKLEAIKSDLASKRADVRWAFANKREIESAVFQWSRDKMEESKNTEALSPEIEEKVRQYEALQSELFRKQMESMGARLPPRPGAPSSPAPDKNYEALSNRVAEAKAPIADILDRRSKQASQYRNSYSADKLVAEFAKDRFDLVVDSSDERYSRSAVLYRKTDEVMDVTEGVIKLFKEKTKQ